MIFLTVGSEYPFDRLVRAVDELLEHTFPGCEVFAQIGDSRYTPKNMAWTAVLGRDEFMNRIALSDAVIAHAGMGTILACTEMGKPLLVMPRRERLREHVNDHQVGTAERFMRRGNILAAFDVGELPARIAQLRTFIPSQSLNNLQGVIDHIDRYIRELESNMPPNGKSTRGR